MERIGRNTLGIMCLHYIQFPFMAYATFICEELSLTGFAAFAFSFVFVFSVSLLGSEVLRNKMLA